MVQSRSVARGRFSAQSLARIDLLAKAHEGVEHHGASPADDVASTPALPLPAGRRDHVDALAAELGRTADEADDLETLHRGQRRRPAPRPLAIRDGDFGPQPLSSARSRSRRTTPSTWRSIRRRAAPAGSRCRCLAPNGDGGVAHGRVTIGSGGPAPHSPLPILPASSSLGNSGHAGSPPQPSDARRDVRPPPLSGGGRSRPGTARRR